MNRIFTHYLLIFLKKTFRTQWYLKALMKATINNIIATENEEMIVAVNAIYAIA